MISIDFLRIAAYIILFGVFWRLLSARLSGTRVGAAMAFVY